jgi:WD40 repeat protein
MKNLFDAFISYGRADSKAFATKLHNRLVEQGLKIWFDQNDIPLGVDYQNQIDDGIEKAHNFLFIIAPHSVNSPYCRKEIELAIHRNKRIIPLLHVEQINQETWQQRNPNGTDEDWEAYKRQGLHTSFQNMHPTISKINWVYFREGIDDFDAAFTGLINLFHRQADYVQQHTQILAKSLEWERHQKQHSYLLIGEERQQAQSWLKIRFKDEQPPCVPTDLHCEFISESTKNANNLLTQVFISHSENDNVMVEKVGKSLMREGFTIWTNRTDIKMGTEFQDEINQGIEQADNVVYLISADSIQSKYCQDEVAYAFAHNKRIISLLIESIDIEQLTPQIRALQFIDFTGYEDAEKYRIATDKLLKALNQDTYYYEQHKVLLVKALKWLRQNRNPSILLRGYNLQYAEAWLKAAKLRTEHPPLPLHEEFIAESTNQPTESSLEVFISYSRADSDFARKLNEALQLQGKTTWFDQESIASGTDFQQEIYRGIENSDNFLFIISPRSVNSPYCADEVEYAQKLNKRFVTVLHRQVSAKELHPALASIQWIDFNRHGGDFYPNFSELVRTLDTDRGYVKSHTKWSQKAAEWEQGGKPDDLLLRGNNLEEAEKWLKQTVDKKPFPTPLQQEYISSSRQAERARQEQEQNLLEGQINALTRFSLVLNKTEQKFDALIEAIRAGRQLQKQLNRVKPGTQGRVLTALQPTVYGHGFRERNRLAGHRHRVDSVSFSPDGKTLASASWDRTVKLWSVEGELLSTLTGHTNWVNSVSFSPDGKTLASASSDNTVKLWSLEGELLSTLTGHTDGVNSISFSPDGQTLASASSDNTVKLWSVEGELLSTLTGYTSVSFSPDGKTIASASSDNTVKLWSLEGELLSTLTKHTDAVNSVSFSPDGKTIASASSDKTIKLWSVEGELLSTLTGHTQEVDSVSFSPDGKTLASASWDNTVKLWSVEGELLSTLMGHTYWVKSVSFSPDGKTLASASWDGTVKLWSVEGKQLRAFTRHTIWVYSVSFSPDGKTIASAGRDTIVKLSTVEGELLSTLTGHTDGIKSVNFSPNGKMIASASYDKTVILWSVEGKLLLTLTEHTDAVKSVSFSPDSKMIASASSDKTVILWSVEGEILSTFIGHTDGVESVSFSPDGKTIASASSDKTVKLWSVEGELLLTLMGHTDGVESVSFSPDGKTIASASSDKTVKLWSVEGKPLLTLKGHTDGVRGVSFSPDSKTIATASNDKTVKLWSAEGKQLSTLTGHTDGVRGVSFSPDGKTIASASRDKTVVLWNLQELQLDKLLVSACDWVRDYLKNNPDVAEGDKYLCDGIGKSDVGRNPQYQ